MARISWEEARKRAGTGRYGGCGMVGNPHFVEGHRTNSLMNRNKREFTKFLKEVDKYIQKNPPTRFRVSLAPIDAPFRSTESQRAIRGLNYRSLKAIEEQERRITKHRLQVRKDLLKMNLSWEEAEV